MGWQLDATRMARFGTEAVTLVHSWRPLAPYIGEPHIDERASSTTSSVIL